MTGLSMSGEAGHAALRDLFASIDLLLMPQPVMTAPFRALLAAAIGCPVGANPAGEALQVEHFWPDCLAVAEADRNPALISAARALRGLTPHFHWRQNPNYRAAPPAGTFLANYGYVEICGPSGLLTTEELRLGVLLLGPHNFYPPHRHPAEEIYLPLRAGLWQRGEDEIAAGDWRDQPPGAIIHHPPWMPHATRAIDHPLAAIYLWRGEVATAAKID